MSKLSRYTLTTECHFFNFRERVNHANFGQVTLRESVGDSEWTVKLIVSSDDNNGKTRVFPIVFSENIGINYRVCIHFNGLTKNKEMENKFEKEYIGILNSGVAITGNPMKLEDILNLDNGFLIDDNKLAIRIRIHVESIQGEDGIWKFNFHDEIFDRREKHKITVSGNQDVYFYSYEWLLLHHSDLPVHSLIWFLATRELEDFLQIAHGVRVQLDRYDSRRILEICEESKQWNVRHYVEWYWIHTSRHPFGAIPIRQNFWFAIRYNLRHYLVHLLKSTKTEVVMKYILKRLDREEMKSESIKIIVAKVLYGQF